LVETALVLPLVLLLLWGVVEVGRFLAVWNGVNTAAREGARYGIATGLSANGGARYTDCDEIKNAAVALAGMAGLVPADVTVTYDHGSGSPFHNCTSGDPSEASISHGDRVLVTAAQDFQSGVPLVRDFLGLITVTGTDTRTIFKEASP
jgi:Flp pilus assembly protein TadG